MSSIEPLLDGFRAFRGEYFEQHPEGYERLAREGQHPIAAVIACADSRVDPAILFGSGPGDLFVIRNVASLVPPYHPDDNLHGTSAAIEFAVRDLGVTHLIVLGHAQCGGVGAAIDSVRGQPPARDFLAGWVRQLDAPCRTALAMHHGDAVACRPDAEHGSIARSVTNLRTFPWIAAAEQARRLTLHGWWFDLIGGALEAVDPDTGTGRRLVPSPTT